MYALSSMDHSSSITCSQQQLSAIASTFSLLSAHSSLNILHCFVDLARMLRMLSPNVSWLNITAWYGYTYTALSYQCQQYLSNCSYVVSVTLKMPFRNFTLKEEGQAFGLRVFSKSLNCPFRMYDSETNLPLCYFLPMARYELLVNSILISYFSISSCSQTFLLPFSSLLNPYKSCYFWGFACRQAASSYLNILVGLCRFKSQPMAGMQQAVLNSFLLSSIMDAMQLQGSTFFITRGVNRLLSRGAKCCEGVALLKYGYFWALISKGRSRSIQSYIRDRLSIGMKLFSVSDVSTNIFLGHSSLRYSTILAVYPLQFSSAHRENTFKQSVRSSCRLSPFSHQSLFLTQNQSQVCHRCHSRSAEQVYFSLVLLGRAVQLLLILKQVDYLSDQLVCSGHYFSGAWGCYYRRFESTCPNMFMTEFQLFSFFIFYRIFLLLTSRTTARRQIQVSMIMALGYIFLVLAQMADCSMGSYCQSNICSA